MEMLIKSTINISAHLKNELNSYVEKQIISSFSSGVNSAIEFYIKELKKEEYAKAMAEAKNDKAFLDRTMQCQKELDENNGEVMGQW